MKQIYGLRLQRKDQESKPSGDKYQKVEHKDYYQEKILRNDLRDNVVDDAGIEPATSSMSTKRSTTELAVPRQILYYKILHCKTCQFY